MIIYRICIHILSIKTISISHRFFSNLVRMKWNEMKWKASLFRDPSSQKYIVYEFQDKHARSEVKTKEKTASSLLFLCIGHPWPNTCDAWAGLGSLPVKTQLCSVQETLDVPDPEDGGSTLFWKVDNHLPISMATYPWRPLQGLQIRNFTVQEWLFLKNTV